MPDPSWRPFTPATVTIPTARLTEWAGLLRQLSVHVPLEDPALTRALEAAQLMQWWAGGHGKNPTEETDVKRSPLRFEMVISESGNHIPLRRVRLDPNCIHYVEKSGHHPSVTLTHVNQCTCGDPLIRDALIFSPEADGEADDA